MSAIKNKRRRNRMKIKESLSFDDVLLLPQYSDINSRSEVDLSSPMKNLTFGIPIISSPMDTVTEEAMSLAMLRHGGLGIIHRYNTVREQADHVANMRDVFESSSNSNINKIAAALPAGGDLIERSSALYDSGARIFCLDIAHGHHSLMKAALETLKQKYSESITLIAGNVATPEAFNDLSTWGADAIRVGIGGGSICSTRIQTGHGQPTFQSILDCRDAADSLIIADGGIKNSGDIVKSLAAGADFVMLGSALAGTKESPGDVFVSKTGVTSKIYRGMASVEAQVAWRGQARSLEGISTTIKYKGSVSKILKDLVQNIKSGLSYTGSRNISEFQAKAKFTKQTSAGQFESNTHILST